MKRKLFGILFTLFLVTPFVAGYFVVRYQIKQVKREVKWKMLSGIDKQELVYFSFPNEALNKDLDWKHDKEFSYLGQMYDVIYLKEYSDSTEFWCWWDSEETVLYEKLNGLLAVVLHNDRSTDKSEDALDMYVKTLFFSSQTTDMSGFLFKSPKIVVSKETFYDTIHLRPSLPPPELKSFHV